MRNFLTMMDTMTPAQVLTLAFGSVTDLVGSHARRDPEHAALIHGQRRFSFAQLDAAMERVAASLQREGLRPGDAVAICAAACIDYAVVFLGALRAGVTVAPLAPSSTAESLVAMLADCNARLLFLDGGAAATLAPVTPQISVGCIALDAGGGGLPLADWLLPAGSTAAAVQPQPHWPFNIIYSSGTTGAPKGIVQPYAMRWAHVQRSGVFGYGPETVTLLSTPLYSNTTLVSFFPTIALGGTVVLMEKFDAGKYLALAQQHRVTHTMLVPVQYQRIMDRPDFATYDLSSFRMKFCTSAPFAAALKADILARWPGGLVEYYGMTEGGGTCILAAHEHPHKLHTVGKPGPDHEIRLIDEQGREVAVGESGEVVGRSAAMMTGYHGLPQATAAAEWHDAAGQRYIRTGDLGRFDADGFLTLLDRKKDMIISGGFNIYPSDLEAVLQQHEVIADCAVVGLASRRWGETPAAFVVLQPGATVSKEALLAWTNARLGKTQRLAALEIVDALPRSAIGKVLKRELRDSFGALCD